MARKVTGMHFGAFQTPKPTQVFRHSTHSALTPSPAGISGLETTYLITALENIRLLLCNEKYHTSQKGPWEGTPACFCPQVTSLIQNSIINELALCSLPLRFCQPTGGPSHPPWLQPTHSLTRRTNIWEKRLRPGPGAPQSTQEFLLS